MDSYNNQGPNPPQNNGNGGNLYPNDYPGTPGYAPRPVNPAQNLITASLVLGISAVFSAFMMTVYLPFILGGISIILAILSKGSGPAVSGRAKAGIACSIGAILLNVMIVGWSTFTVFNNPDVYRQFNSMYEQLYGESFEDMYRELTGREFPGPQ